MIDVCIKVLCTIAEFNEFIELQKVIWRLKDYKDCIPNHVLLAVSESGGIVFGAYCEEQMIGFALVLPAYSMGDGHYHHSHILGVHPDWQHKGIGLLFKKEHYQKALTMGVKKITWTYDPLLGPNANLNVAKLGGIVREYRTDVYGELMGGSELVSGIPSDRFWLEWFVSEQTVTDRMQGSFQSHNRRPPINSEPVNRITNTASDLQQMESFHLDKNAKQVLIEIPVDFQMIYDTDKELALDWRLKSREMFRAYFDTGFTVVDFYRVPSSSGHRNYYFLDNGFPQ